MQTFPIIPYLRRLAAARGGLLLRPLELNGEIVMCRDEDQASLILSYFNTWKSSTADEAIWVHRNG